MTVPAKREAHAESGETGGHGDLLAVGRGEGEEPRTGVDGPTPFVGELH